MPMFYTPKPRQFNYRPRFYDPEQEKWEQLKKKYSGSQEDSDAIADPVATPTDTHTVVSQENSAGTAAHVSAQTANSERSDIAYFNARLKEIDEQERAKSKRLTWKDLFVKRKMPTFHYTPLSERQGRSASATVAEAAGSASTARTSQSELSHYAQLSKKKKISRRFEIDSDDYFKPVDGTKIVLYGFIALLLLGWILF